jgi:hypothetical protein
MPNLVARVGYELLTPADVTDALGITRHGYDKLVRRGLLKPVKRQGRIVVTEQMVQTLISSRDDYRVHL